MSAHIAANGLLPTLCLCVIEVVEGSAMDALQRMQKGYLDHGHSSLLNKVSNGTYIPVQFGTESPLMSVFLLSSNRQRMDVAYGYRQNKPLQGRYPLSRKSALTEDWFKGLSGKFLASRAGKVLLLAGTDRLDKR